VRLLVGLRAVLDAAWDDEQLALLEHDVPVAQLDRQASLQDEEEVVGLVVLVPDELAEHLHDDQLVVVQVADDARAVRAVEKAQLLGQVHLVVHAGDATRPPRAK
jgi:hypothetical protein